MPPPPNLPAVPAPDGSVTRKRPRIVARIGPSGYKLAVAKLKDPESRAEEKETTEWEVESRRFRSRTASLLAAAFVHVLIALIAALVVTQQFRKLPPVIEIAGAPQPTGNDKPILKPKTKPRVSAAGKPIRALSSAAASPVAIPAVDNLDLEPLDLGTMGISDLGFGSGLMGGANFLGLSAGRNSRHVVLLIDVSGSMYANCGQDGLQAIKDEVAKTVNGLKENILFNIYTFASDADGFAQRSVKATGDNKKTAVDFFNGYFKGGSGFYETRTSQWGNKGVDKEGVRYVPIESDRFGNLRGIQGSTRLELGVIAAMQNRPQTIFIISDGDPQSTRDGTRLNDDEIIRLIDTEYSRHYRQRGQLRISTISIDGQGARVLKKIAKHYGGIYKSISPASL